MLCFFLIRLYVCSFILRDGFNDTIWLSLRAPFPCWGHSAFSLTPYSFQTWNIIWDEFFLRLLFQRRFSESASIYSCYFFCHEQYRKVGGIQADSKHEVLFVALSTLWIRRGLKRRMASTRNSQLTLMNESFYTFLPCLFCLKERKLLRCCFIFVCPFSPWRKKQL